MKFLFNVPVGTCDVFKIAVDKIDCMINFPTMSMSWLMRI